VVDISSGEEDVFPNTSRDEEITQKLFNDLNRGLLRPPGDGNMIILRDSNKEEEEVHEDDCANAEDAPSIAGDSLASIASTATDDDAPDGVRDDSNGGQDEAGSP
jgi:hypothetical protein